MFLAAVVVIKLMRIILLVQMLLTMVFTFVGDGFYKLYRIKSRLTLH